MARKREVRLAEATIERCRELLVDIDLRIVVQSIDREFAARARFS